MKPDISTPADIRLLIDTFYVKVQADDVIGFIFNDIAQVDWPKHLPVMYAFWEFLLLGTPDAYKEMCIRDRSNPCHPCSSHNAQMN